jgi:hypothetical protein
MDLIHVRSDDDDDDFCLQLTEDYVRVTGFSNMAPFSLLGVGC